MYHFRIQQFLIKACEKTILLYNKMPSLENVSKWQNKQAKHEASPVFLIH